MGFGMPRIIAEFLLVIGSVHRTVFDGHDGRRVQGVQDSFIDPLRQPVFVEALPALPRKRGYSCVGGALWLGRGTRDGEKLK
jgi:hypothetical protein